MLKTTIVYTLLLGVCFSFLFESVNAKDLKLSVLPEKETKVYVKTCEAGYLEECIRLGKEYLKEDAKKSLYYYSKACDLDDANSCILLGTFYYKGFMVEQDIEKSREYLEKVISLLQDRCNSNDARSCMLIGSAYSVIGAYEEKKAFYEKACELGELFTCYELSTYYALGFGIEPNEKKLTYFIQKALPYMIDQCDVGSSRECYRVGEFYITQNQSEKSLPYFKRSCDLGAGDACSMYASYFIYIGEQYNIAKKYAEQGCDNKSDAASCKILSDMYKDGKGVDKDQQKSQLYLDLACKYNQEFCLK